MVQSKTIWQSFIPYYNFDAKKCIWVAKFIWVYTIWCCTERKHQTMILSTDWRLTDQYNSTAQDRRQTNWEVKWMELLSPKNNHNLVKHPILTKPSLHVSSILAHHSSEGNFKNMITQFCTVIELIIKYEFTNVLMCMIME